MGNVWKSHHVPTDTYWALKVVDKQKVAPLPYPQAPSPLCIPRLQDAFSGLTEQVWGGGGTVAAIGVARPERPQPRSLPIAPPALLQLPAPPMLRVPPFTRSGLVPPPPAFSTGRRGRVRPGP